MSKLEVELRKLPFLWRVGCRYRERCEFSSLIEGPVVSKVELELESMCESSPSEDDALRKPLSPGSETWPLENWGQEEPFASSV